MPSGSEKKHLLGNQKLFSGIHDKDLLDIADICQTFLYPEGQVLFESQALSREIYLLTHGEVSVESESGVYGTIQAPASLGEMGVLTEEPRSASAITSKEVQGFMLPQKQLFSLIHNNHMLGYQIYYNALKILSQYLNNNNLLLDFYNTLNQGGSSF